MDFQPLKGAIPFNGEPMVELFGNGDEANPYFNLKTLGLTALVVYLVVNLK